MNTLRNELQLNYTSIPNELINTGSIHPMARFLFIVMASKPDDWTFYHSAIQKELGVTRPTFTKYMDQLLKSGWVSRERKRQEGAKFDSYEYRLHHPEASVKKFHSGKNLHLQKNNYKKTIVEFDNSTAPSDDVQLEKPKQDDIPYAKIVQYLNKHSGKNFRHTTKGTKAAIRARWNEGFTLDDFKAVIQQKCRDWKGNAKMSEYLRPNTLFGTKFESYLQKAEVLPGVDNTIESRIDCQLDEESFNAYHAYHSTIRQNLPNLFHYVPILSASEYLAIRPGGARYDGLRVQMLDRHIREALNEAHSRIERGLLEGKQYDSVKSVLDQLLKIKAHA